MNRRRSEPQKSHAAAFTALILMVVIGTFGGAMHAIYRNGQIQAEREIAKIRERIEEHRIDIQMVEIRQERELDRYEIRARLESYDSTLVAISHGVVETVHSLPYSSDPPVALRP